jgi:hypothetical protein
MAVGQHDGGVMGPLASGLVRGRQNTASDGLTMLVTGKLAKVIMNDVC